MNVKLFYNVSGYSVWTVPELPAGKLFWTANESIANRQECLAACVSKKTALRVIESHNKKA